jgi:hypothetical protein
LNSLAKFIDERSSEVNDTNETQDLKKNTLNAKKMTELLFLSRILVLKYCLSIIDCRDTFSSKSWAILQICPTMFMDVFSPLFDKLITQIPLNSISALTLYTVVRHEFTSLRDILLKLNYPNFSNETKLRLDITTVQHNNIAQIDSRKIKNRNGISTNNMCKLLIVKL